MARLNLFCLCLALIFPATLLNAKPHGGPNIFGGKFKFGSGGSPPANSGCFYTWFTWHCQSGFAYSYTHPSFGKEQNTIFLKLAYSTRSKKFLQYIFENYNTQDTMDTPEINCQQAHNITHKYTTPTHITHINSQSSSILLTLTIT